MKEKKRIPRKIPNGKSLDKYQNQKFQHIKQMDNNSGIF